MYYMRFQPGLKSKIIQMLMNVHRKQFSSNCTRILELIHFIDHRKLVCVTWYQSIPLDHLEFTTSRLPELHLRIAILPCSKGVAHIMVADCQNSFTVVLERKLHENGYIMSGMYKISKIRADCDEAKALRPPRRYYFPFDTEGSNFFVPVSSWT